MHFVMSMSAGGIQYLNVGLRFNLLMRTISSSPPRAVQSRFALDSDGLRRADGLAELAG